MKTGTVYFITAGPFVKIGWTGRGVGEHRVDDLQTGCPYRMHVEVDFEGTVRDESVLHWYFAEYHERGEWYRLEGRLKAFLDSLDPKTCFRVEKRDALLADARRYWQSLPHHKSARDLWKSIPNTRDTPKHVEPFTWGAA